MNKYNELLEKYVELADKYAAIVDKYLDFRQAILDPENQPSQYGTMLIKDADKPA